MFEVEELDVTVSGNEVKNNLTLHNLNNTGNNTEFASGDLPERFKVSFSKEPMKQDELKLPPTIDNSKIEDL
jgi:hypothetical protein